MYGKEQYVTWEAARLLKEKGFDWQLYSYFSKASEDSTPGRTAFVHNFNDEYCGSLSRPTQQMACRWMREEKGIDIFIDADSYGYRYTILNNGTTDVTLKMSGFDSYEDALEEGLKYSLTNLI